MSARLVMLVATAVVAGAASPVLAADGPQAVFAAYSAAANAADLDGVRALIGPDMTAPPFSRCAPSLSGHDCMIDYINETVIKRHSHLTTIATRVKGNVVMAKVELRNDATRAAGVDRITGTDRMRVKDGKIEEFAFLRDEHDDQTKTFFDFMRRSAPKP